MFRLAERVGRLDVDVMASELSSPQLSEWMAHEQLEPSVGDRIDANAALDRWRNHRDNGGTSQNPDEFRLRYGRTKKETPQEKIARIKAGFAMLAAVAPTAPTKGK